MLKIPKTKLALSLISTFGLFSTNTFSADLLLGDVANSEGIKKWIQNGEELVYNKAIINITPVVKADQYTVNVKNGSITFNGSVYANSYSNEIIYSGKNNEGVYLFHASGKNSVISFNNDVDLTMGISKDIDLSQIGGNVIYSQDGGKINIGSKNSSTKIKVVTTKPDVISAKNNGFVEIKSTNNQIVGNFDLLHTKFSNNDIDIPNLGINVNYFGSISGTFSGNDSFWFGDEVSWQNVNFDVLGIPININQTVSDNLDLTFENGASWIYIGNKWKTEVQYPGYPVTGNINSIPKRITSIKLLNGGVIDLYEKSVKYQIFENGLTDFVEYSDHNYVRIGDLKGSNGIFRLDLNADDHAISDMIFIEGSSDSGTHGIEVYEFEKLNSVSSDNILPFAIVNKSAGVAFNDRENFYGDSLFNHQLFITSKEISDLEEYNEWFYKITKEEDAGFDKQLYADGKVWYIYRVFTEESEASKAFSASGEVGYDMMTSLDTYRERMTGIASDGEGLWVRVRRGETGISGSYNNDYNMYSIGANAKLGQDHNVGAAFTYLDGQAKFAGISGQEDLEGYELKLYDTWTLGNGYLDLTARIGRMNSDFSVSNVQYSTTGDFDQTYSGLGAEYGYTFDVGHGFTLEPQAQLQYTFIRDTDYEASRNMKVDIDSSHSLIGRAGLRAGYTYTEGANELELAMTASVLHQFTDGQDAVYSSGTTTVGKTYGDRGTWGNAALSANLFMDMALSLRLSVGKNFGGDFQDDWNGEFRASYAF